MMLTQLTQTTGTGWMPMMQGYYYGSPGAYGFGLFFMVLWWIIVIIAIAYFVRWLLKHKRGHSWGSSALHILKERYAKGEINKQEYEEKLKDLQ